MSARVLTLAAALFAFGVAASALAVAAQAKTRSGSGQEAIGGANVQYARVAVFIGPSGPGGIVVRSKGVKKVKHPFPGVYCIQPEQNLNSRKLIPSVTTERGLAGGADLLAHWESTAPSCPNSKRWLQVETYRFNGTSWVQSATVPFTLVVP